MVSNTSNLDFILLSKVHLGLELKPPGIYQKCPCCGGRSSFIIYPNQNYKCFKPSCDLWKGGTIFTFFEWAGLSYSQTCKLLGLNPHSNKTVITDTRSHTLNVLLDEAKDRLLKTPHALEYIHKRYNLTKSDLSKSEYEIGYANCLPQLNFYNEDRIIFPIRDHYGGLVHYHTRSMDSNSEYRWLPTTKIDGGRPFGDYLWNAHLYHNHTQLFLTEGISDGLTLTKLGFPTISLLSLTAPILELLPKFHNLNSLIVIFDNDKVPLNTQTNKKVYKSWDAPDSTGTPLISRLLHLAINNPKLKIWCLMPPNIVGVKDVNDWVQQLQHTKQSFIENVTQRAQLISDFTINYYWDDTTKHPLIIKSINNSISEQLFLNKLNNTDPHSWLDYIKTIL